MLKVGKFQAQKSKGGKTLAFLSLNQFKFKTMNKLNSGYYRTLLKDSYPNIRIAFTHTPIVGCTIVDNTLVIKELEKSTDPFAQYYIEGIKSKEMVTIVENQFEKTWANNGELYFKS